MKTDISPAHLRYFLQEELYLLKADQNTYTVPQPAMPTKEAAAVVQATDVTQTTPELIFKYLGGNQKSFLVLTYYLDAEFIADMHLNALISTITRINFSQQDIAIVNMFHYPNADWAQLVSFFNPEKLLVLGNQALPAALPKLNQNEVRQIDSTQALYTFSFNEMMGNKENTKTFWNQIKTF